MCLRDYVDQFQTTRTRNFRTEFTLNCCFIITILFFQTLNNLPGVSLVSDYADIVSAQSTSHSHTTVWSDACRHMFFYIAIRIRTVFSSLKSLYNRVSPPPKPVCNYQSL